MTETALQMLAELPAPIQTLVFGGEVPRMDTPAGGRVSATWQQAGAELEQLVQRIDAEIANLAGAALGELGDQLDTIARTLSSATADISRFCCAVAENCASSAVETEKETYMMYAFGAITVLELGIALWNPLNVMSVLARARAIHLAAFRAFVAARLGEQAVRAAARAGMLAGPMAAFSAITAGVDLTVQLYQIHWEGKRDGIDWASVGVSALSGAGSGLAAVLGAKGIQAVLPARTPLMPGTALVALGAGTLAAVGGAAAASMATGECSLKQSEMVGGAVMGVAEGLLHARGHAPTHARTDWKVSEPVRESRLGMIRSLTLDILGRPGQPASLAHPAAPEKLPASGPTVPDGNPSSGEGTEHAGGAVEAAAGPAVAEQVSEGLDGRRASGSFYAAGHGDRLATAGQTGENSAIAVAEREFGVAPPAVDHGPAAQEYRQRLRQVAEASRADLAAHERQLTEARETGDQEAAEQAYKGALQKHRDVLGRVYDALHEAAEQTGRSITPRVAAGEIGQDDAAATIEQERRVADEAVAHALEEYQESLSNLDLGGSMAEMRSLLGNLVVHDAEKSDLTAEQGRQYTAAAQKVLEVYIARREELLDESWDQRRRVMEVGDEAEAIVRMMAAVEAGTQGEGKHAIVPRSNQGKAYLLGLNGFMRQMGTGQGKTVVGFLDSLHQLSRGKPVVVDGEQRLRMHHVLTTTELLANEGRSESAPIFESLGYGVSRWNPDHPVEFDKPTVIYLTYDERATSSLKDSRPPGRTVTIDEVDAVTIHNETTHYLSDGTRQPAGEVETARVNKVLDFMLGFHKSLREGMPAGFRISEYLREHPDEAMSRAAQLWEKQTGAAFTDRPTTVTVNGTRITLQSEAEMARAFLDVKAGRKAGRLVADWHFQFFDGQIQILDANGKPMSDPKVNTDSRWFGGRHQMLEAMYRTVIYSDGEGSTKVTVDDVLNEYDELKVMSGTLRRTADEIKMKFPVQGGLAEVEDHQQSRLVAEPEKIFVTQAEMLDDAVEQARRVTARGRPVLFIARNDLALRLDRRLSRAHVEHVAVTGRWFAEHRDNNLAQENLSVMKKKVGQAGQVTVGTPGMLGRGFDPTVGEAVNDAGGMHVQGIEHSLDPDTDDQTSARAGRNGQNGSYGFSSSQEGQLADSAHHQGYKIAVTHYRAGHAEHAAATAEYAAAERDAASADTARAEAAQARKQSAQEKLDAADIKIQEAERDIRRFTPEVQNQAAVQARIGRVLARMSRPDAPPADDHLQALSQPPASGSETSRPHYQRGRLAGLAGLLGIPVVPAFADALYAEGDPLRSVLGRAGVAPAAVDALTQQIDMSAPALLMAAEHLPHGHVLGELTSRLHQLARGVGSSPAEVTGPGGIARAEAEVITARGTLAEALGVPAEQVTTATAHRIVGEAVTRALDSATNIAATDRVAAASRFLAAQALHSLTGAVAGYPAADAGLDSAPGNPHRPEEQDTPDRYDSFTETPGLTQNGRLPAAPTTGRTSGPVSKPARPVRRSGDAAGGRVGSAVAGDESRTATGAGDAHESTPESGHSSREPVAAGADLFRGGLSPVGRLLSEEGVLVGRAAVVAALGEGPPGADGVEEWSVPEWVYRQLAGRPEWVEIPVESDEGQRVVAGGYRADRWPRRGTGAVMSAMDLPVLEYAGVRVSVGWGGVVSHEALRSRARRFGAGRWTAALADLEAWWQERGLPGDISAADWVRDRLRPTEDHPGDPARLVLRDEVIAEEIDEITAIMQRGPLKGLVPAPSSWAGRAIRLTAQGVFVNRVIHGHPRIGRANQIIGTLEKRWYQAMAHYHDGDVTGDLAAIMQNGVVQNSPTRKILLAIIADAWSDVVYGNGRHRNNPDGYDEKASAELVYRIAIAFGFTPEEAAEARDGVRETAFHEKSRRQLFKVPTDLREQQRIRAHDRSRVEHPRDLVAGFDVLDPTVTRLPERMGIGQWTTGADLQTLSLPKAVEDTIRITVEDLLSARFKDSRIFGAILAEIGTSASWLPEALRLIGVYWNLRAGNLILSDLEAEVLALLGQGRSDIEIAADLTASALHSGGQEVSVSKVAAVVSSLLTKTGAADRATLAHTTDRYQTLGEAFVARLRGGAVFTDPDTGHRYPEGWLLGNRDMRREHAAVLRWMADRLERESGSRERWMGGFPGVDADRAFTPLHAWQAARAHSRRMRRKYRDHRWQQVIHPGAQPWNPVQLTEALSRTLSAPDQPGPSRQVIDAVLRVTELVAPVIDDSAASTAVVVTRRARSPLLRAQLDYRPTGSDPGVTENELRRALAGIDCRIEIVVAGDFRRILLDFDHVAPDDGRDRTGFGYDIAESLLRVPLPVGTDTEGETGVSAEAAGRRARALIEGVFDSRAHTEQFAPIVAALIRRSEAETIHFVRADTLSAPALTTPGTVWLSAGDWQCELRAPTGHEPSAGREPASRRISVEIPFTPTAPGDTSGVAARADEIRAVATAVLHDNPTFAESVAAGIADSAAGTYLGPLILTVTGEPGSRRVEFGMAGTDRVLVTRSETVEHEDVRPTADHGTGFEDVARLQLTAIIPRFHRLLADRDDLVRAIHTRTDVNPLTDLPWGILEPTPAQADTMRRHGHLPLRDASPVDAGRLAGLMDQLSALDSDITQHTRTIAGLLDTEIVASDTALRNRTSAEAGTWLRDNHPGLVVEGFDRAHPAAARRYARTVHYLLIRYPHIDPHRCRFDIGEIDGTYAGAATTFTSDGRILVRLPESLAGNPGRDLGTIDQHVHRQIGRILHHLSGGLHRHFPGTTHLTETAFLHDVMRRQHHTAPRRLPYDTPGHNWLTAQLSRRSFHNATHPTDRHLIDPDQLVAESFTRCELTGPHDTGPHAATELETLVHELLIRAIGNPPRPGQPPTPPAPEPNPSPTDAATDRASTPPGRTPWTSKHRGPR
ncbi:hypothetical protein ABZV91_29025 [Nocardia sp. NPDC004568]|uniref:hypothetical protein n=1 Tax=Nocardia sp. NPDC004568 TaxID=3154551 RepID=UPI0033B4CF23